MCPNLLPPIVLAVALTGIFPLAAAPDHALVFDGANDYVETNAAVIPTSGNFTVEFWAECPATPNSYREIISQGGSGNAFYIGTDPSNNIRLGAWVPSPAIPFPVGGWHRFALVRSTADTRFYIDGVLKASLGSALANPAASTGLRFGRQCLTNAEYWPGSIGDVRVWNRDLGAGELHQSLTGSEANLKAWWDFHESSGTTCTSAGASAVAGTLVNGPFWSVHSTLVLNSPNSAISFDGVDDYVDTGAAVIPGSGDFTVEFWAECPAVPNSYREIISQGSSGNAFYIGSDLSNNIRLGDGWGAVTPAVPMPIGGWHHFALVKSSANTLFYLDGVLKASRGWAIPNPAGSTGLRFGRQYGGIGEYWSGGIGTVNIWTGARSYNQLGGSVSSSDPALVAAWDMGEAYFAPPSATCGSVGPLGAVGTLINGPEWSLSPYSFHDNGTSIMITGSSSTAIGDLVIPDTISGKPVTTIGVGAFSHCALTSVVLPATLTSIDISGFNGCASLHHVEFLGNAPTLASGVFANAAGGFVVKYHSGTTGFTSPTWNGFTSYNVDTSPEIAVEQGISLTDGQDTVHFGNTPYGNSSSLAFTIRNTGHADLTGLAVNVSGADAGNFSVSGPGTTSLPAGGNATFTVSFTSQRYGSHSASLRIASNDVDENPFDIPIHATSEAMLYTDNGSSIAIASGGPMGFQGALYIPSNLNGKPVTSVNAGAFSGNNYLTSVNLPASVGVIGVRAFANCPNLGQIVVDAANPTFSSADGVLFNKAQTTLIQCPGGMTGAYAVPSSATEIGASGFYGCSRLTAVTLPTGVRTLQDRAFYGCGLLEMLIPKEVSSIGAYAFFRCGALTAITVDAANPLFSSADGVLFDKAKATLIQFPGYKAGAYAIPGTVITIASGGFGECGRLSSVSIPASVTSIGVEVFLGCGALNAITVGASNPNYSSADGLLFNKDKTSLIQCPGNKTGGYAIPAGVTSIGRWAFGRCAKLTSVTLPQSMASIDYAAFANCGGLTGMTFPAGVTALGDYALWSCSGLAIAEFMGNAPVMGIGVFDGAADTFRVGFHNGASGFTTPTWFDYPSVNLDAPTYATWLAVKFTTADIATGMTGMAADFDLDGVSNLLEYAFGGNPKVSDAAASAPTVGTTGNKLRISFKCDATRSDLTYTVQASTTLAPDSWTDIATSAGGAAATPIGGLSTVSDPGGGTRVVTVTDAAAISATSRKYLRLKVTGP